MKEEVKDYRGIAVRITPGRCFFQVYQSTKYIGIFHNLADVPNLEQHHKSMKPLGRPRTVNAECKEEQEAKNASAQPKEQQEAEKAAQHWVNAGTALAKRWRAEQDEQNAGPALAGSADIQQQSSPRQKRRRRSSTTRSSPARASSQQEESASGDSHNERARLGATSVASDDMPQSGTRRKRVSTKTTDSKLYMQQLKWLKNLFCYMPLPGDLEDLAARRMSTPKVYTDYPWLVVLQAGLKFGPWRGYLEIELKTYEMQHGPGDVTPEALYAMLRNVCYSIADRHGINHDWIHHCNRVRNHGPVAFLKKLGLIQPHSTNSSNRRLVLGKSTELGYQMLPWSTTGLKTRLDAILRAAGTGIRTLRFVLPRNTYGYLQAVKALVDLLEQARLYKTQTADEKKNNRYSSLWMARSILHAELKAADIVLEVYETGVPREMQAQSLEDMSQLVPDVGNYLQQLGSMTGTKDIAALALALGFSKPCPSLMAMMLCLFHQPGLYSSDSINWQYLLTEAWKTSCSVFLA